MGHPWRWSPSCRGTWRERLQRWAAYAALALLSLTAGRSSACAEDEAAEPPSVVAQWALRAPTREAVVAYLADSGADPWVLVEEARLVSGVGLAQQILAAVDDALRPDTIAAYLARDLETEKSRGLLVTLRRAGHLAAQGDWQGALALLEAGADLPFESNATTLQCEVLRGHAQLELQDLDGIETLLGAAEQSLRLGWMRLAEECFREAMSAAFRAGLLHETRTAIRGLRSVQEAAGDALAVAGSDKDLAQLCMVLGDFGGAESCLADALTSYEEQGLAEKVVEVTALRSLLRAEAGDLTAALDDLRRASDGLAQVPAERVRARVQLRLAQVHWRAGSVRDADPLLAQAVAILDSKGDPRDRGELFGVQGLLAGLGGDHVGAGSLLAKAAEAFEAGGDLVQAAVARINQASQLRKAVEARLMENGTDAPADPDETKRIGEEGLSVAQSALEFLEEHGIEFYAGAARFTLAELLHQTGQTDQGLALLRRCRGDAQQQRLDRRVVEVDRALAACSVGLGRWEEAQRAAMDGVAGLQRLHVGLPDQQRARAMLTMADVMDVGALAAVQRGDHEALLRFLEAGRAASMVCGLGGRAAVGRAYVPAPIQARLADARRDKVQCIAELGAARGRRAPFKELHRLRDQLDLARQAEVEAMRAVDAQQARAFARALPAEAASVKQIQEFLAREAKRGIPTAAVWWSLQREQALALVVGPAATRVVTYTREQTRAIRSGLARLFVDARGTLNGSALDDLRTHLVEPLGLEPALRRVLISPDRDLGYTPLCLLLPPQVRPVCMASGAAHLGLAARRAGRGRLTIALGNPRYAELSLPGATVGGKGARLVPLPDTQKEVEAVAKGSNDIVLTGAEATEGRLVTALRSMPANERVRSLHLATHGVLNAVEPALTYVAMTPGDGEDGILSAAEASRLELRADLVVLSACDTARGPFLQGEGILGLSRAFQLAGATAVLASLWQVESQPTSLLMVEFYRRWNLGEPLDAALRAAQDHVRNLEVEKSATDAAGKAITLTTQPWADPKYWAAWVLWGLPD